MCQPTSLGAEAGIYQSLSGLLSVLFRTNQLFQDLLFKLVLVKLPVNLKTKSFLFTTSFKNTFNQIPSPLFKTLNPTYVHIKHPLNYFRAKLARYFKLKRLNPNIKILPTYVFNNFNLCCRTKCHSVWPLFFLAKVLKIQYHLRFLDCYYKFCFSKLVLFFFFLVGFKFLHLFSKFEIFQIIL